MTNAIAWCYGHRVSYDDKMVTWIKHADITTMDDFWDKCDRGDWMLLVLAKCSLGTSAQVSRLEFVVSCVERALAKVREEGHELNTRVYDAMKATRGVVDGMMDESGVWVAADEIENVPCDHEVLVVEAATDAAMYAVYAALEVISAGSSVYNGHVCAFQAASSSVLAVAGDNEKAKRDELRWQADTLRELLQPDGGGGLKPVGWKEKKTRSGARTGRKAGPIKAAKARKRGRTPLHREKVLKVLVTLRASQALAIDRLLQRLRDSSASRWPSRSALFRSLVDAAVAGWDDELSGVPDEAALVDLLALRMGQ